MAPSICHLPGGGGGAGYKVLPWSDLMITVVEPWNPLLIGRDLDLLLCPIYIFVLLTRLFFNPHTAHSDVGGTMDVFAIDIVGHRLSTGR
jgi:hypothetical protein